MFTDELVSVLVSAGLGTYGTTLFVGSKARYPAGDGPFLTIIETGGSPPDVVHNNPDIPGYVRPSAQIVCRALNYMDARAMAQSAYDALFMVQNQFINGTWWLNINCRSEPFDLQEDDKGRARVVFNIDCLKRSSPATSF